MTDQDIIEAVEDQKLTLEKIACIHEDHSGSFEENHPGHDAHIAKNDPGKTLNQSPSVESLRNRKANYEALKHESIK